MCPTDDPIIACALRRLPVQSFINYFLALQFFDFKARENRVPCVAVGVDWTVLGALGSMIATL